MSRQNVEIVRAGLAAWNAADVDALRKYFDPEVIWRPLDGWPEPGPFVGREAVMRWFEQLREAWDADSTEVIGDFVDDGDRVAVRQVWHGVGSGPDSSVEFTNVFTLRYDKIAYVEQFWSHSEAIRAVIRSEHDARVTNEQ